MKLKLLASLAVLVIIVGCTVPVVVNSPDGTQTTEHKVDPKLDAALKTVGTIGGAVPQPWGWIIGAGAAAVGGVAQTLANRKNKKAANQWEDIATTIIQGVEAAGEGAASVKKSIAVRASNDGNSALVDKAVQDELR